MIDVTTLNSAVAAEAEVIYAIGDIHGRVDLLDQMEAAIAADIDAVQHSPALICYLGDYIDRGPNSAQVIDRLCGPFDGNVARVFLRGNHEDRMIDFLEDPVANGPGWIKFGGREALESYGLEVPEAIGQGDWTNLRDLLLSVLPDAHRDFLNGLKLGLIWHNYLLVHAGIDPTKPLTMQSAHDLMWMREPFLSCDVDWGLTVIHGHVIVDEPIFRRNRIGIDTGAYQSGLLTCLAITEHNTRLIQVRE
jgi:serine/threonine protein phosphatase 1